MRRRSFLKSAASLLAGLPLVLGGRAPKHLGIQRSVNGKLGVDHSEFTGYRADYEGFDCVGRGATVEESIRDLIENLGGDGGTLDDFMKMLEAVCDCCRIIESGWPGRVEGRLA